MARPGESSSGPGIPVVLLICKVRRDGLMRQIAGSDNVQKRRATLPAHSKTLCQMNFDEVAIAAAQLAEGIQSLHDTGSPCPPRAHATGKGNDSHPPRSECLQTKRTVTIIHSSGCRVFNKAGRGQAVLGQTDAP